MAREALPEIPILASFQGDIEPPDFRDARPTKDDGVYRNAAFASKNVEWALCDE